MLQTELERIIRDIQTVRSESNTIEIKAAGKGCPKVRDTLSSFSNQSGGGILIFGVDEADGFQVCGVYDAADLMKKVEAQCLEMTPVIRPLFTVLPIDGKTVVSAEIQEIDNDQKPCFYSGVGRLRGSYIRSGDADRLMTEYEVYSFEAFRKKIQDELRTSDRADMKDIQTSAFERYLTIVQEKKPNLSGLSAIRGGRRLRGSCCSRSIRRHFSRSSASRRSPSPGQRSAAPAAWASASSTTSASTGHSCRC